MDMTKMLIDAYMKPLYDGNPQGTLMEAITAYEARITAFAKDNPGSMDIVGDSGTRDEYNQLYMAVLSGNHNFGSSVAEEQHSEDHAADIKLPTVHEFLDSYRMVYESSAKSGNSELTDRAYQELFNVENRTDDVIEAQLIIEKEGLLLNTITADYKSRFHELMEAADPNYEVTFAATKATLGAYADAKSIEEINYRGEIAKATCDDITAQIKMKIEMVQVLMSLVFAWEHSKRKLREGGDGMEEYAKSMVLTRSQTRRYYKFLSDDMGITWDVIKETPFYRILMLNPQGLDELWRIKKVMHPENLKTSEYVLFGEILSDRPLTEILMSPQPYPYYEMPDSNLFPAIGKEYTALADKLNKDINYFKKTSFVEQDYPLG